MPTKLGLFFGSVLACLLLAWSAVAYGGCGDTPGNLIYNCNLDDFGVRSDPGYPCEVPDGWVPWVTMGRPAFTIDLHGSASGAPAQRIWSDGGTWTAGLYQQVQVAPNKGYRAWVEWSPPQCPQAPGCTDIERRIGIDPMGGTDPLSPRVVWGPSAWGDEKMADVHVAAFAQSPTITVFLWTHHGASHGQDQVYLDSVILVEDASVAPPAPPPTSTPTRRPPTSTPAQRAAAATRALVPSQTLTPSPTATFTPTATLTPSPTLTITPTVTFTPTPTRTPAPTPLPPTGAPPPAPAGIGVQVAATMRTPDLRPVVHLQAARPSKAAAPTWLLAVAGGAGGLAAVLGVVVGGLWVAGRGAPNGRGRWTKDKGPQGGTAGQDEAQEHP